MAYNRRNEQIKGYILGIGGGLLMLVVFVCVLLGIQGIIVDTGRQILGK